MCGSPVIVVEDEEQGRENTAKGEASGAEVEVRKRDVDPNSLRPMGQKIQNPHDYLASKWKWEEG